MGEKVSFREKLSYGLGDAGCNFVWTTIGSFLTLYYTDSVGISAAVVGTIMLLTRLLDGGTDLVMGSIIDRTKTRWGKARPWILWSSLPMALGIIFIFNVPKNLGNQGKIAYAVVSYIFVAAFAYTACNLSYNTLLSLITNDQKERTSMSSIRFLCTMCTALIISFLTPSLVEKIGWSKLSFLYGGIALLLLLVTFFGTKERYIPISTKEEKIPVFESFRLLFKNKHFILVTLIFVLNYAAMGVTQGTGIYFARDVLGNAGIFGVLTLSGLLPVIVGLFIFPTIAGKFGKWKIMLLGYIIQIVGLVIIMTNPTYLPTVVLGLAIKGIGAAPHTAGLFALVADVVDYGEWKSYKRLDGLTYSATSFGMKVGTGIGTAMTGWVLAFGNYNSSAATQAPEALTAMKALYIYIPIVLVGLGFIVLYFANIDKDYEQITKDLADRRSN